jgi:hypothetical protein
VVIARPVELLRLIHVEPPTCRVRYKFEEASGTLRCIITEVLEARGGAQERTLDRRQERP